MIAHAQQPVVPVLLREGYRLFFPWAALLGLASIGAWAHGLGGGSLPFVPAQHAALLIFGAWGALILGFLMTAFPRQSGGPMPKGWQIVGMLALHAISLAAVLLPSNGVGRAVVIAAPWALATLGAARLALPALGRGFDGTTAGVPAGVAAATVAAFAFGLGETALALRLATHGFLVYVALVMLDRILPFFTARALAGSDPQRRPGFAAALGAATLLRVAVPEHPYLGDIALLGLVLRQWLGWRPWPSSRLPMIGGIHLGVAWIVAGYVVDLVGVGPPSLPMHFWLLGGLGSFWAALSIRVTRGHGGLPILMRWDGALILGLVQLAAVLRIGAAFVPSLFVAAGTALSLAFFAWLLRFAPLVRLGG